MHDSKLVLMNSGQALLPGSMVIHDMRPDCLPDAIIAKLAGVGGVEPAQARLGGRRARLALPLPRRLFGGILLSIRAAYRVVG